MKCFEIYNTAVVFRPDTDISLDTTETYAGEFDSPDALKIWCRDKCVPLVR